ncbi:MAG: UDP-3-O-(3-hydroxymyristoyl)glucosamine N-acyltransferase [Cyclobacteriaceae bacterium]
MKLTVNQLAELLGGEIDGDGNQTIDRISTLENAHQGSISFLHNPQYEPQIYSTQATAVLVKKDFSAKQEVSATLIKVEDPYLSFTALLQEYHKMVSAQKIGVESPAYIGKDCKVGNDIYRGAFSYIGDAGTIGDRVKIFPHAYIGDQVTIGSGTVIHPGAKVYSNTVIGKNCVVHSGAVIGSDGFGFAPQTDGSYQAIPQIGNVILKDNVSIGANTTIDCATLDSTIIHEGAKLDNLIQIAHNVEIGENTVVAALSGISGSTKIGSNCVIAGQVGLVGHIEIADKVTIGAQAGIGKSIKTPGSVLLGSPGFQIKNYMKSYAIFRKLPDLVGRIDELEKKVLNLPAS